MRLPLTLAVVTLATVAAPQAVRADDPAVAVRTDFPGGNAVVVKNAGAAVELAPDLRGGRDWFYWCFEATAARPGEVTFTFPAKVAGFTNGAVGHQGPAVSTDGGKTWNWMGNDTAVVRGRSFTYSFTKAGEAVRLAVTIPYLQADWAAFVARQKGTPHLDVTVLTKSRKGRAVELVRVGRPGPGVTAVLVTARHHACESVASFALEGLIEAAAADTPAGRAFREKYVLYAVPFADKDGVEDGDQGKWRAPHDHNRDYTDTPLYPEVRAIKELGEAKGVRAALDLHCPTLVMDDHQVLYFAGLADAPAGNKDAVTQLARRIKGELPKGAPAGPLVWLRPSDRDRDAHFAGYFGRRPGVLLSATLEIPYAPRGAAMDPASVRSYGAAVLRAWTRMEFAGAGDGPTPKK